jgi:2-polyprenyl-3-methyl-5-hydroxy-6-metoxy-1,4-benzoquinol methylase
MSFKNRSYEEELMDDLASSGDVIEQTLKELETINKLLGGNQVTTNGLNMLLHEKKSSVVIADLGCGGGDILKLVAKWAEKKGLAVDLIGFDANPHIIDYARENCKGLSNISFEVEDIFGEKFKQRKFDIILCTLFTHHFTNDALINIFKQFKQQVELGVVINDLHRHWVAYYSIKILTQLFSKSDMVKYDGPLSVKRSFKRNELLALLQSANIQHKHLSWQWAFRWQLVF